MSIHDTHSPDSVRRRRNREKIVETIFVIAALISVLAVALITLFIFYEGTPGIFKIGFFKFIFGPKWKPESQVFGILPMIISSLISTAIAVGFGVAVGLFVAIFLADMAPPWMVKLLRPVIELLAGIPSVVYGYFGLIVLVPLIRNVFGGTGVSLLAVIAILTVMILPTIINISTTAIKAVPKAYKEGSLGLGASHMQTIFRVILPSAKNGIAAAIVLGIGRAIGETMAVIMVAGNTRVFPTSLLAPCRTLTINIAFELGYATGLHEEALFSTGVVLFVFIMILNIVLNRVIKKKSEVK